MQLSEENKKRICEEIRIVIEKMKNSKDMNESLYYLSAIHSIIHRIYNFEFNKHLIFIHFVLANSHRNISTAVEIARQGKKPITINLEFFSKLIDLLGELANLIEENK